MCASLLRYPAGSPVCIIRDFLLLHFTRSRVIPRENLELLKVREWLLGVVPFRIERYNGSLPAWQCQA